MSTAAPTFPRYRILETIGRGGMGEVCLAEDLLLHRRVALKFLNSPNSGHDQLLAEARAAASLDHPFICKIFEITELESGPCIVMEYVRGDTLERRLRRGPLAVAEVLRLAEEIAEALEAAHKRRLVHRDLKPANVIVTDDGHIKVMDFGIAIRVSPARDGADWIGGGAVEAAQPAGFFGTPAYMAPEQLQSGIVDRRSDIFSCGVLLYELLSGTHPFHRGNLDATLKAILSHSPDNLRDKVAAVPASVAAVVARMLEKDPETRYQSFGDVRLELRRLSATAAPPAEPAGRPVTIDPSAALGTRLSTPLGTSPSTGLGTRRAQLVGREPHYAELVRMIGEAAAGRGGLLLVEGEAGVGKSRLVEEALNQARQLGGLALAGHCSEQEGTPPLEPYIEVLEDAARLLPAATFREVVGRTAPELARFVPELYRLFPDMPLPLELPPELRQRFLFSNMREFITRCSRVMPLTIFLDDLHWADDSTLQLTQHLAQHLDKIPVLIIGAFRERHGATESTRANTLGDLFWRVRNRRVEEPVLARIVNQLLGQRLARVISLSPLPEAGVASMLAVLGRREPPSPLVRRFVEETGGNPFFVEELFRHLNEEGRLFDTQGRWRRDLAINSIDVPAGIRAVISQRLRRVSTRARDTLIAAAVIGRHFDPDVLEAIADVDGAQLTAALDEAEQAHLLKGPSGRTERRWRFAHQLVRQALTGTVPQVRLEKLHVRVADELARLDSDSQSQTHTSEIAHHLYSAGRMANPERTTQALMAAASAAGAMYATDDALEHYGHALEILNETGGREQDRLHVQERLADVLALMGDRATAMTHYLDAVTVHEKASSRVSQGRIIRKIGNLHWQAGNRKQASDCYARALLLLDGEADALELSHLYQELGLAAFRGGDNQEAIRWAERALASAEAAHSSASVAPEMRRVAAAAVAHAMNTIGVAQARSGQLDAARQRIERSVEVAMESGLLDVACRAYANLGVLYSTVEPRRAIEVSQTGLELATRISAIPLQPYLYANLAAAYCALTDHCETEGLEAAQTAVNLDREMGQLDHLAVPLIVMAQIHQCQGELQQAHDYYQEALELAERIGEPQLLFPCYDGLAMISLDRGDRNRAREYMEKGREVCERTGIDPDTLLVLPFLC